MPYEKRGGHKAEQCRWMIPHALGHLAYGHWRCQADDGHSNTPDGHEAPPNAAVDRNAKWVLPA